MGAFAHDRARMLLGLTIRDVVLIERLELAFRPGLCVLTGETGAGKSILLDALGLALGARADSALVRRDAAQAIVAAEFSPAHNHPSWSLLDEQGIAREETLVLRRSLAPDGRSRAFVNDQPVGVAFLKQLGDTLVEVQGQFEQRGLLDAATHRTLLDAFGGHADALAAVEAAWRTWRAASHAREAAAALQAKARAEEDFLRHAVEELAALDPKPAEETALAEERARLSGREKLIDAAGDAAGDLASAERGLMGAAKTLARARERAAGALDGAAEATERALIELREASSQLAAARRGVDMDPRGLERAEERLFALRAAARKHGVPVDALAARHEALAAQLAAIEDGGAQLRRLGKEEAEARAAYVAAGEKLSSRRKTAARRFDTAVAHELPPLKLEKAKFSTVLAALDESEWGEHGCERVRFEIATNPGAAPGPLAKIASGGELSRFLLALKVVLAKASPIPTLVFDEVDAGVGGAVASAVGERLQRLAEEVQILVVTHSPQVAAKGTWHWRVEKRQERSQTRTTVEALDASARREEIARMLAGATVTAEARAAADSLMTGA
jgi:DNA repair protein RecN (Recombination protein N)